MLTFLQQWISRLIDQYKAATTREFYWYEERNGDIPAGWRIVYRDFWERTVIAKLVPFHLFHLRRENQPLYTGLNKTWCAKGWKHFFKHWKLETTVYED